MTGCCIQISILTSIEEHFDVGIPRLVVQLEPEDLLPLAVLDDESLGLYEPYSRGFSPPRSELRT
jgi:hypothetical protein